MLLQELPSGLRPREKILAMGPKALTDAELLDMDRDGWLFALQELSVFGPEILEDLETRLQQLKRSVAER